MSAVGSWTRGMGRVGRAPALIIVLWVASLAITLPPALWLNQAIETHLGDSLAADQAADGVNFDWMQEFRSQASASGRTLRPEVIGFAAVMDNTSTLADMRLRSPVVATASLVFVLVIWALTPGFIHRLAANRPIRAREVLATSGAFGVRMLRLGFVSALAYAVLFGSLHPWLFRNVFDALTRETTVERTAFAVRLALYLLFFLVVAGVNLLLDYTKVRLVVEDRHSVIGAMREAARFVRDNARVAIGVYALNVLLFFVVLGAYAAAAPGAGSAGWSMWGAFAIGQLYLIGRLAVKLAFWGAEIDAVQTRFECPGFVRRSG